MSKKPIRYYFSDLESSVVEIKPRHYMYKHASDSRLEAVSKHHKDVLKTIQQAIIGHRETISKSEEKISNLKSEKNLLLKELEEIQTNHPEFDL